MFAKMMWQTMIGYIKGDELKIHDLIVAKNNHDKNKCHLL